MKRAGMPGDHVHVLFTMDVEPVTTGPDVSGPQTPEAGAAAIRNFAALLGRHGYRSTFFVHPEVARDEAALFRGLATDGHALGLHLHPVKFGRPPAPVELGGLPADRQREVLGRAMDEFTAGLGERPKFFRPGCFSANDETFRVLVDLGFSGGSVSIPGRIWPERYCVWSGAYPYTHRARTCRRNVCWTVWGWRRPSSIRRSRRACSKASAKRLPPRGRRRGT
jgi:peptidoglycan/xylan/chitin deacetylase (PgdA/CDA1 family)